MPPTESKGYLLKRSIIAPVQPLKLQGEINFPPFFILYILPELHRNKNFHPMSKPYKVTVNGTYEYELSEGDLASLDILKTSGSGFHVLKDNIPFPVEVISGDFNNKIYKIKVRNDVYEVGLQNELDQQIARMGFSLGSAKNITSIIAPMPGLILEIKAREGEEVKEDSPLLILEAMKMENVITSPREGIIKSISVRVGETVDKKQLLITYA